MAAKQLLFLAGLGLAVLLAVGLIELARGGGGSASSSPPATLNMVQMRMALAGSPLPLAALHAQADELLPGGHTALRSRLAALRGWPVVINKWASWCEACRAERAVFEHAAVAFGRRVAFLGIDSGDTVRGEALAFLRAVPLTYPSYYDPSEQLGTEATDSAFMPVTVFYNRAGGEYIHQGAYPSAAKLARDVERYALAG